MPQELRNLTSPTSIVTKVEYDIAKAKFDAIMAKKEEDRTTEERWICSLPITKEMQNEYLAKYGCDNWYDWAIRNWGTKWGAYDVGDWKGNELFFFTAWSVPEPVYEHLSTLFPKAKFEVEYADEGGGWCGVTIWQDGIANPIEYNDDYKSPEYKRLYEEITGIPQEEEDE